MLSQTVEYALRAVVQLAYEALRPCTTEQIAEATREFRRPTCPKSSRHSTAVELCIRSEAAKAAFRWPNRRRN